MKTSLIPKLAALALAFSPLGAGELADQFKKIDDAYQEKLNAFKDRVEQLPREEQRNLYRTEYPDAVQEAENILRIISINLENEDILDGINWTLRHASQIDLGDDILAAMEKHHLDNPKMGDVVVGLLRQSSDGTRKFLRTASEKSENKDVRGLALYALSYDLDGDPESTDERVAVLEKIINDYSDLKRNGRSIADVARGQLFAAKNLQIGQTAPEITGQDVDGKEMKLSDYRGKVVVLDFWGHW